MRGAIETAYFRRLLAVRLVSSPHSRTFKRLSSNSPRAKRG